MDAMENATTTNGHPSVPLTRDLRGLTSPDCGGNGPKPHVATLHIGLYVNGEQRLSLSSLFLASVCSQNYRTVFQSCYVSLKRGSGNNVAYNQAFS